VGDSYQKVIADNGQPPSRLGAGAVQILVYPAFTLKLRNGAVVSITGTPPPSTASAAPPPRRTAGGVEDLSDQQLAALSPPERSKALQTLRKRALDGVNAIVNQPVASVPLTRELQAAAFGPPWFHPGASMPDFDHVDVRKTQETAQYAKWEYIRSDVCPGLAFHGADVEFNSNTKYFYQDRTLPKKLLTEAEMVEINRLYRIIGKCNAVLGPLPPSTAT